MRRRSMPSFLDRKLFNRLNVESGLSEAHTVSGRRRQRDEDLKFWENLKNTVWSFWIHKKIRLMKTRTQTVRMAGYVCVCGGALNRSTPQMILNHWKQKDICSLFARGSLTLNLIKNTRMAIQASFPNAHCLRSVWLRPAWPGAPLAAILHWIPILISSSAAVFVSQLICKFLNLNY